MGSLAWKVLGTGSAVMAGIAAKKVVTTAWTKSTGKQPPANPEAPGTSWPEAVAWAAASGAVVGLFRMFAARKAAAYYKKSSGHLPPGVQEVG